MVGGTPVVVVVVLFPSSKARSRFLARPLFLAAGLTRARSTSPSRLPSPSFFLSAAAAIASAARERGGRRGRAEAGKGRGKGSAERHPLDEVYRVNERDSVGVEGEGEACVLSSVVPSVYPYTRVAPRRGATRGVPPRQRRRKSQPLSSAECTRRWRMRCPLQRGRDVAPTRPLSQPMPRFFSFPLVSRYVHPGAAGFSDRVARDTE